MFVQAHLSFAPRMPLGLDNLMFPFVFDYSYNVRSASYAHQNSRYVACAHDFRK